jgi:hypothetical protein
MDDAGLIIFRTYINHFEADVAKTALEANGIECFVRSDDCGGMRPHFWLGGVELLLKAEDVESAEEILGSEEAQAADSTSWETNEPWQLPNPN